MRAETLALLDPGPPDELPKTPDVLVVGGGVIGLSVAAMCTRRGLDTLLIDTHPGLNEETLLSLVISHTLIVILRPDRQDYEGTGITVRVARELQVPRIVLVVNKAPEALGDQAVADRVRDAYGSEVVAVIPHSDELMSLASEGVFVLRYPDHPLRELYTRIADAVIPVGGRA